MEDSIMPPNFHNPYIATWMQKPGNPDINQTILRHTP